MPKKRNYSAKSVPSKEKEIEYIDSAQGGFFTFIKDDQKQDDQKREKVFFTDIIHQKDSPRFRKSAESLLSGKGGRMLCDDVDVFFSMGSSHSRVDETFYACLHPGMSLLQLLILLHPGHHGDEKRKKQEQNYKDFLRQAGAEGVEQAKAHAVQQISSGKYVSHQMPGENTLRTRTSGSSKGGHSIVSTINKKKALEAIRKYEFDPKKCEIDKSVEMMFSKKSLIWQVLEILKKKKDKGDEKLVKQILDRNAFFCSALTFAMLNYCEDIAIELVELGAEYEEDIKLSALHEKFSPALSAEFIDMIQEVNRGILKYGSGQKVDDHKKCDREFQELDMLKEEYKITTLGLAAFLKMEGLIECLRKFHTGVFDTEHFIYPDEARVKKYLAQRSCDVSTINKEISYYAMRRYLYEYISQNFHAIISRLLHSNDQSYCYKSGSNLLLGLPYIFFKNNPFEEVVDRQELPYLLDYKKDMEAKLFQAVESNDVEMVKSLLLKVDVNIRASDNVVDVGDADDVQRKILDVTKKTPTFFTLLHYACIYKKAVKEDECIKEEDKRVAIFEEILRHKPDIDLRGKFGLQYVTVKDMLDYNMCSGNQRVKDFGKRLFSIYKKYAEEVRVVTARMESPLFSVKDLSEEEHKPSTNLADIAKDDVSKVVSDCQCGKSSL